MTSCRTHGIHSPPGGPAVFTVNPSFARWSGSTARHHQALRNLTPVLDRYSCFLRDHSASSTCSYKNWWLPFSVQPADSQFLTSWSSCEQDLGGLSGRIWTSLLLDNLGFSQISVYQLCVQLVSLFSVFFVTFCETYHVTFTSEECPPKFYPSKFL